MARALRPAVVAALLLAACSDDAADRGTPGAAGATGITTSVAPEGAGLAIVGALVDEVQPSVVAVAVSAGDRQGEGSGVIVREDGLIATNNHVVADANRVQVLLADGSVLDAEVEATDPLTDLALLRVDRDGLPAATLAEDYPEVGDLAVAVGNPLGFDNTVTAGIISGLQRALPGSASGAGQALVDLIQTDAAISPGNSGGALAGAGGDVVGITVAYIPPAAGAVNLGFAIPAPTVRDVIDQLLAEGRVDHPYVGIRAATLTPQAAERFGIDADAGAVVLAVEPGSPADEAGVLPGDTIVALGGERVDGIGSFLTRLRAYEPGDSVAMTVVRERGEAEVTVALVPRPAG